MFLEWTVILVIAFFFGTFIGSFLNVCIHRLPRNESVVTPGSRCYSCGTHVQWYDNIPILSYLLLRGRCRWCGSGFSPRYLLMELAVGLLTAVAVWWCIGQLQAENGNLSFLMLATAEPQYFNGLPGQIGFAAAILCLLYYIFVSAVIDIDHRIIPDELTKGFQCVAPFLACLVPLGAGINLRIGGEQVPNIAFAIERHFASTGAYYGLIVATLLLFVCCLPIAKWVYTTQVPQVQRWQGEDQRAYNAGLWVFLATIIGYLGLLLILEVTLGRPTEKNLYMHIFRWSLMDVLLGCLMGWALPYFVGIFGSLLFRKGAMGYGDVKFLAPIGAFVGPIGVIEVFFCAALIGTLIGVPGHLLNKQVELPFGPYLAAGAVVTLLWGSEIAALMLPVFFV